MTKILVVELSSYHIETVALEAVGLIMPTTTEAPFAVTSIENDPGLVIKNGDA